MTNPLVFFREAHGELKKVTWIPRKQMMASTLVVAVLVLLVSFYIAFVDFLVAQIFSVFIRI